MSALQITAITLCFTIPLLGWALLFRQTFRFVKLFRMGTADPTRHDQPGARTMTVAKEFFGHTRMSRLPIVSIAHWFTAISFFLLFATLVNAFFQLIWADFRLPVIGHFAPFEWLIELFAWGGFIGVIALIVIRQKNHPRKAAGIQGRRSRFFGSTWWQAYYVEATIFGVMLCILLLRSLEARMVQIQSPDESVLLHFPLTGWMAGMWGYMSLPQVFEAIYIFAMLKILISFAWMITISLQPTMGVAWHRFLAFFNIWFKRDPQGGTALGSLKPMLQDGKPMSLADIENMGEGAEDDAEPMLGVGKVEDFSWKALLDFTTCTECGRCQSQCPAWNTDKPLSPKLVVMTLRDHAHAKAPWVLSTEEERHALPKHTKRLAEIPLIGDTGYEIDYPRTAYDPLGPDAIIDEDVLWSCTTCGACVEQCPVDIEHVDAIVDMRRNRVLIESAFPTELGGLFKNMEGKSNPWGMAPKARMDWAKGLDFEVPVLGADLESLDSVEYLFWVGCAGAYEDRAKKTTRAVAELLHTAGVTFAVLGEGEACTGDSARRAGNEILFQMLAQQNVEMLNEFGAKKIVVTCAHCYNTLRNEYPGVGGTYQVMHHTQLLNRLVRDRKLIPVSRPGQASSADVASTASTVTYHDPCYLGRHNHVYAPPRDLIATLPGVQLKEMMRSKEKSFCCGAGGARMWMEENLGSRVNLNRTQEAVSTGAERIAIGCPFCRVMLSDGLTAAQSEGAAGDTVEVVDIAQMLLAAVRPPVQPKPVEEAPAKVEAKQAPAEPEVVEEPADEAVVAEPEAEPEPEPVAEEAAPEPKAEAPTEEAEEKPAPKAKGRVSASDALAAMAAGGATKAAEAKAEPEAEAKAEPEPEPEPEAAPEPEAEATPEAEAAPEPEPAAETAPPAAPAAKAKGAWKDLLEALGSRTSMPASEALSILGSAPAAAAADTEVEPAAEPAAKAEPEPEPEAKAEPEPEPEAKEEAKPEPEAPKEPAPEKAEPAAEAPAPAPAKPAPKAKAAAAPSAAAKGAWKDVVAKLGSRASMPASEAMGILGSVPVSADEPEAEPEPEPAAAAEPAPEPAAETKAEPEAKEEPEPEPESEAKEEPQAKPEPEPAPEPEAKKAPEPDAEAEVATEPEPAPEKEEPTEAPKPAPAKAAKASEPSPAAKGAWKDVVTALNGRTSMPASEALQVLQSKG